VSREASPSVPSKRSSGKPGSSKIQESIARVIIAIRGDGAAPGEDWELCEGILEQYAKGLSAPTKSRDAGISPTILNQLGFLEPDDFACMARFEKPTPEQIIQKLAEQIHCFSEGPSEDSENAYVARCLVEAAECVLAQFPELAQKKAREPRCILVDFIRQETGEVFETGRIPLKLWNRFKKKAEAENVTPQAMLKTLLLQLGGEAAR